ncbi:hypothetical protein [Streptomyces sp. NPDC047000]|uniref:hypothetical protein n=1 Tax=Streptomyces sp. NPDC047000 TaxID=3155474 RepID=UPI0033CB86A6
MPATESEPELCPQPSVAAGPTMRALLASCAAAEAVSRPPAPPAARAVAQSVAQPEPCRPEAA